MRRLAELRVSFWRRAPLPAAVRRMVWARRNPPSAFVQRHLGGMVGVEIGASAHNDYGLRAINIDRYPDLDTPYKREEISLCGRMRPVDLIAPGDELPFRDDAVDFVFASHVIEHFPDPLRALFEWTRVARRLVVVVVPHRDRTFDADRELSPVQELIDRHAAGFTSPEDKHWSVWTRESFVEMCDAGGLPVVDSLDPDDKLGNGFVVVIDAATPSRPAAEAPAGSDERVVGSHGS